MDRCCEIGAAFVRLSKYRSYSIIGSHKQIQKWACSFYENSTKRFSIKYFLTPAIALPSDIAKAILHRHPGPLLHAMQNEDPSAMTLL